MFKNVFLAATLAGLLAGVAIPMSTPAEASSGCWKAAKAKYATDWKARHEYRKWCRAEWKAYKKPHHTA